VSDKVKKYFLVLGLYHLVILSLLAQGELSDQPRIFYRNEKSIGVLLNTNGYGISGRYSKRINARKKTIYELDLIGIKHPKEVKITNYYNSNKSYVFGKLNSFFDIRAGYGRQKEMFRKADRGGISIRRFYSIGPSLGLLKPVYYKKLLNYSEYIHRVFGSLHYYYFDRLQQYHLLLSLLLSIDLKMFRKEIH